jgi:hypothetical protein
MNMIKDKAIDDLLETNTPQKNYTPKISSIFLDTAKFYTNKIVENYQKRHEIKPTTVSYMPNTYSNRRRNEPIVSDMGIVGYKY